MHLYCQSLGTASRGISGGMLFPHVQRVFVPVRILRFFRLFACDKIGALLLQRHVPELRVPHFGT